MTGGGGCLLVCDGRRSGGLQDGTSGIMLARMNPRAVLLAFLSAALFGLSTPAAKALVGAVDPTVLAGLLYLGAVLGIAIVRRLVPSLRPSASEAPLARKDAGWLAGAVVAGGVIGPVLMMSGLEHTGAATASLLLTLEGLATALLAWFVFHESFDRRIALGMAAVVAGALVLAWSGAPTWTGLAGPLAIVGACVAWGLDNNLTRRVSLADPLQIVELKGLIAGPVSLLIGLSTGGSMPPGKLMAAATVVGFLGYGVSLVLYIRALRALGTARTGAYFSTAPFLGALASVVVLHEPLSVQLVVAGALMALGVWLHLTERHDHEHVHEAVIHSHAHVHDEHHRHEHLPTDPPEEPHVHAHRHARFSHRHAHVPDMHHTHRH